MILAEGAPIAGISEILPAADLRAYGSRAQVARERARLAREAMEHCVLCAHACGVNRIAGERGQCGAGTAARVFSAQTEVSDEVELIPVYAIALSGCDLRCDFCITGAQSWNADAGLPADPRDIATEASRAWRNGARTIMILGGEPTIHLAFALEIVSFLPDAATLVWKTNAHATAPARALLDGMFDFWVVDYKFGNDLCARRLAHVQPYETVIQENLLWASEHTRLIVRHLLMPGHVECCWRPIATWLGNTLPGTKVNLRSGFWPAWRAARHPELRGTVQLEEARLARRIAEDNDLHLVS
jgi:putative pyruvate formate lyase activating enzyme